MEPAIVLLGPPGSGKGTQAERLRDARGFVSLATGDLLREARATGTELGKSAAGYMDRGDLVPDEVIAEMMRDAIAGVGDKPILLDGFPRTVAQADALARALESGGRHLAAAILVDVPDDVVAERISHRNQGRADDREETVKERLRVYHRDTEPLIEYYRDRGLLRPVDGSQDEDAVEADIRNAVDAAS